MPESPSGERRPVLGGRLPTWSYEHGTEVEVAEWVLGSLIAWVSRQLGAETDEARVSALREESAALAAERRRMLTGGPEAAAQVLRVYGPRQESVRVGVSDTNRLPTDEYEQVFREEIVPRLLSRAAPQEHPVAFLLGGQPGIGKSSTKGTLHEALADVGGAVDFSADLMRPFHKKFAGLLQGDERLLHDLDAAIDEDAHLWVD